MIDPRVTELCKEYGLEIIPKHLAPLPGQTRAVATIRRLIDRHGEGHARLVLTVFAECKGNQCLADEASLNAVSDVLRACPDLVENATSELLDLFDKIPLGVFSYHVSELRGIVPQRPALAGLVYFYLRGLNGVSGSRPAAHARNTAGRRSEEAKGRTWEYTSRLSTAQKIAMGRRFLEAKAKLPHGHFGPWLEANATVSAHLAHQCMRLAREADEGDGRFAVAA